MLREQKNPYGLGFALAEVSGSSRFGHGGADGGFQALFSATNDGQGFVIMISRASGRPFHLLPKRCRSLRATMMRRRSERRTFE